MKNEKLVRVNIMLSEPTLEVIDDYKDLMGISRSQLMRGLISEAIPNLRAMLEVLEGFDQLTDGEKAVRLSRLAKIADTLDANVKKGIEHIWCFSAVVTLYLYLRDNSRIGIDALGVGTTGFDADLRVQRK